VPRAALSEFLSFDLFLYILLGFLAQLIDGALGMAYGLIATSTLLATGLSPVAASASVHAAEVVTTGLAGGSHVWNRNIDWKLFARLATAGVIGGVIGAYVLIGLPETAVKIFVSLYLLGMTGFIARRILSRHEVSRSKRVRERKVPTAPVGFFGGLFDAIGGGGWGPIVTSTLLARGDAPRFTIGSVSASEFFVSLSVSLAFLFSLDFTNYARIIVGLIIGGALAAPLAGFLSRVLAPRTLLIMVMLIVGSLSLNNLARLALEMTTG
jgi:uncharacterized protein